MFDIVLTNPPWELLKPDRREIERLPQHLRGEYIAKMQEYDRWIADAYPRSQPKRKFAGWGTNLSRVGLEASLLLARAGGIVGSVLPASIFADDQSSTLRRHLLSGHSVLDIAYYPAEAKQFGGADVSSATVVAEAKGTASKSVPLLTHGVGTATDEDVILQLDESILEHVDYVLPVAFGAGAASVLGTLATRFPTWLELERDTPMGIWAGREVDETGSADWLAPECAGHALFAKGRMIDRYRVVQIPTQSALKPGLVLPASVAFQRIVWRDVSRPNQRRRVIASLIPAGWLAGNSLGVTHFRDGNDTALRVLLGIMNSTSFECQLRAHLATGHVSLSALRKVSVPPAVALRRDNRLAELVSRALTGDCKADVAADAHVARRVYRLSETEYATVLGLFPKITISERAEYVAAFHSMESDDTAEKCHDVAPAGRSRKHSRITSGGSNSNGAIRLASRASAAEPARIFNHVSAKLSAVDMQMVHSVPEGGNWKDIPHTIPSKRLEQIRESFKRGEGSRSTYYGRLRSDRPAYTINTYFNRPGNGCHIHYGQHRVLSQREAARLQSFPDAFEFLGSQGAIYTQIGNAVPPLLAYQIAGTLGQPGAFVDLFAGAGGMGLGFSWAGWTPIVANDIERTYLETYARNVHRNVVTGSIGDPDVFDRLLDIAKAARSSRRQLWVLGGPPCQGFSTAGKRRSMDDGRNHLAWDYVRFLEELRPDGFVFENVTGLLNMDDGRVFAAVRAAFAEVMPSLSWSVVSADEHAIPQRRKRVILVGRIEASHAPWAPPSKLTAPHAEPSLFSSVAVHPPISVSEALSDLPVLNAGEDGSMLAYRGPAASAYQAFMRGLLSPVEYLARVANDRRSWKATRKAAMSK